MRDTPSRRLLCSGLVLVHDVASEVPSNNREPVLGIVEFWKNLSWLWALCWRDFLIEYRPVGRGAHRALRLRCHARDGRPMQREVDCGEVQRRRARRALLHLKHLCLRLQLQELCLVSRCFILHPFSNHQDFKCEQMFSQLHSMST